MQLIKKDATIRTYEKENQKMAFKSPIQQAQALVLANPTDQNAQAPIIQAKPQRFTRRPRLEDYGLQYGEGPYKKYKDAYYYSEPNDIDAEIAGLKESIANNPNDEWRLKYSQERLDALSDPNVQKYIRDSRAFSNQFQKDADEYYPTAKDAIIRKLLADGDLYRSHTYGGEDGRRRFETDDIFDTINDEFGKKYGYTDAKYQGDLFSPTRYKHSGFYSPLGEDEDIDNGYRQKYKKADYIGELLRSGELTLDDLKRYILGK